MPHVGYWVRSNEYSRAAAPLSSGWFGHRRLIAACAVGEGHRLNRASGHFDLDDAGAAVGLLRPAARHKSVGQSGTVAASGCVIRRRMESRSSATSSRRNMGNSTRRGLLRGAVVQAHAEKRGQPTAARKRLASPTCAGVGLRHRPSARAARGGIRAPAHSRTSRVAGAHSTGGSNTQMEPSRPTVCAIMALRRAAHLQR